MKNNMVSIFEKGNFRPIDDDFLSGE